MNAKGTFKLNERNLATATRIGVLDKVDSLISQLAEIEGMVGVDIDLDSLEELNYVSLLPHWDESKYLAQDDFYNRRLAFLNEVLRICKEHGMTRTEDRLEDYGGGWFYIVLRCDWLKPGA